VDREEQFRGNELIYASNLDIADHGIHGQAIRALFFGGMSLLGPTWNFAHGFDAYYWTDWPYVLMPAACFLFAVYGVLIGALATVKARRGSGDNLGRIVRVRILALSAVVLSSVCLLSMVLSPSLSR
jgi:hypothetical protein